MKHANNVSFLQMWITQQHKYNTNILMFIERKVVKSKQNSFARLKRVSFFSSSHVSLSLFDTGIFECFSHKY
jgi:hypothetical protein